MQTETLQLPTVKIGFNFGQPVLEDTPINGATIERYLCGLRYPVGKAEILHQADANSAPENIMAFFVNRLPMRHFRSASDISFTVFMSSYFFGQD